MPMEPWPGLTYEELQKAYKEAMQGSEVPSVMTTYCAECDTHFVLTKSGEIALCEHLTEKINRLFSGSETAHADG